MKNLIFIFILFTSLSYSQEIYTYKSGGRVYEKNRKLSKIEIENYFGHKPEIINLYNKGINKRNTGNILFYSGIAGTIGILSPSFYGGKELKPGLLIGAVVTSSMILISIPIKIGYPSKIKKAVQLMNDEIKNQNTGNTTETSIIANENGIGLKITF